MKFGTSYLSNKIYAGNTRTDKNGLEIWTKKTDVTEAVIKAVFEYMYIKAEDTGKHQVEIKGYGKMTLVREGEPNEN